MNEWEGLIQCGKKETQRIPCCYSFINILEKSLL